MDSKWVKRIVERDISKGEIILFGLFFNNVNKKYKEEKEKSERLKKEVELLTKRISFLEEDINSKCSKNDSYEIARRYLLKCLTFNSANDTQVEINASELFEIFNIPFDLCLDKFQRERGEKLFLNVSLKLKKPVTRLEDININEVITKEILDELMER